MACLSVPEGELDELLEHVPLATRRNFLLSSNIEFNNQGGASNSPGLLHLPHCNVGNQVGQHLPQEHSLVGKVTASASEVANSEHRLDSGAVAEGSQCTTSSHDVGLPMKVNSQGSPEDHLTGSGTNADASGLGKIIFGVSLPPDLVPSNVSDIIKAECADNMLLTSSKYDTNSSPSTGVIASCKDLGLPISGNSQGSQADQLTGTEAKTDTFELEKISGGVPLPLNAVPLSVSDIRKVDTANNLLPTLSKDDTGCSASASVMASCQGVWLPMNGDGQGSQIYKLTGTETNADVCELEKINAHTTLLSDSVPSSLSDIKKVNGADNMLPSLSKDGVIAVNTMDKVLNDFTFDEMDHIVLKERQNMLLKRKLVELEKPALEGVSLGLSALNPAAIIKQELQPVDGECMTAQNHCNVIPIRTGSDLSSCSGNGSSRIECSAVRIKEELQFVDGEPLSAGNVFYDFPNRRTNDLRRTSATGTEADRASKMEENNIKYPSKKKHMEFKSLDGDKFLLASRKNLPGPTLNSSRMVKPEPLEYSNLQNSERSQLANMTVKCEEDSSDVIDHMLLRDRMKLTSFDDLELNNSDLSRKTESAAFVFSAIVTESVKPINVIHPRKRRKTVTDSVEKALEEDAPELLRVLLDKGVSVDEIKLYGEPDSDDPIDESFIEDSFSELEAVMTKLWSHRSSLLSFAPLRCSKGTKPSYCLACLFALVEQTRYLQFRKWPVEWGWCRDLQSFIFVFRKHHRIVLERPEYGFATYFFELVDSKPIAWQVKRLVTAMKLTGCGRIALIENKPLLVGEDLSDGEAKVLLEYGWVPNTGLGTMLNYCDRVYHDRKNESDSSEWRSKIGNLLVDGYNGGSIVSASSVNCVMEDEGGQNTQIKLES